MFPTTVASELDPRLEDGERGAGWPGAGKGRAGEPVRASMGKRGEVVKPVSAGRGGSIKGSEQGQGRRRRARYEGPDLARPFPPGKPVSVYGPRRPLVIQSYSLCPAHLASSACKCAGLVNKMHHEINKRVPIYLRILVFVEFGYK
ncbi:unnamed protein product [Nesidiocoris tenuis]|uniref:Uncharacterized protein n=1 Tax=Nesidiocoris tenuis TaxID=355587 RepID=A0A6H5GGC4_9HEMI|nr:unnamed protein product [Nesidiocoris tenuis]